MKQTKIEIPNLLAKKKGMSLKTKLIIGGTGLIMVSMAVGSVIITNKIIDFFKDNTIVRYQPIKLELHKPFEIITRAEQSRREMESKMIEDITNKAVDEYLHPKAIQGCKTTMIDPQTFFDTLRMKESSMGKNTDPSALHNYCKAKGQWNEIGYNPANKFCFKDQEEARLYVAYYAKKNCDNKTQAQCECFWNTGDMTDSCHYSKGELSQAN